MPPHRLALGSLLLWSILSIAACGRSALPARRVDAGNCGNGQLDEGEACDAGELNGDAPALWLEQGDLVVPIRPLDRTTSFESHYDYSSESSHTGFEEVDLCGFHLFRDARCSGGSHADTAVKLVIHCGIDEDISGVTLEHGLVEMDIAGFPDDAEVTLSDEGDELTLGPDGIARGRWEFWRNADGGVIDGLPLPGDWTLDFDVAFLDGMNRLEWRDGDGNAIALDPDEPFTLHAATTPSPCRRECIRPSCGDGILDAGERCDGGPSGERCSDDCAALVCL